MDGWVNKTSDFNMAERCLFPVSITQSTLVFNHVVITVTMTTKLPKA